jgi:hypothetical protein
MEKEIGENKGMKDNPLIKHALTKTNSFEWVEFGEYLDIKRKGCPPVAQATMKTKKPKIHKSDEEEETSD